MGLLEHTASESLVLQKQEKVVPVKMILMLEVGGESGEFQTTMWS
jgi:hypothetical protein